MAKIRHLFLLLLLFILPLATMAAMTEMETLLLLKKSFTNAQSLNSWQPGSPVCGDKRSWVGVICFSNAVMGLRLGGMGLSGEINVDALVNLPRLRSISITNNSFSGPIPSLNRLRALKAMYLSGNKFSGEIPPDFFSNMGSLKKIWLSRNSFSGTIPTSLANLKNLIELHLDDNAFSGALPPIDQPKLKSFNVSNNALSGKIPTSLKRFGNGSFVGNERLCGDPLDNKCNQENENEQGISKVAVLSVVLVVVIGIVGLILTSRTNQREGEFDEMSREIGEEAVEIHVAGVKKETSSHTRRASTVPQLTIVNEEKGVFGMPDLMKAAAEVLGNGGLGSSYKAVMANGVEVVVKRMREMNRMGDDGFEVEMRRLGRLRHPNVLPPLAFHFRKEEKLLVYEYIPRGSLLYLLHGDRGQSRKVLDWSTRLRIIQGIARGMAYIHTELASSDLPHGNLKSSNVLLNPDLEPLLIDYGYSSLVATQQASQALFAYRAPESIQYHHVSHKSDVYCLGILILEILTGKFPSQYLTHGNGGTDVVQMVESAMLLQREFDVYDPEILESEKSYESMGRCLRLGAACTELRPERRPDMQEAVLKIEEIVAECQDLLS